MEWKETCLRARRPESDPAAPLYQGATPKGCVTPEPVTQPTKCSRKCPNLAGSFRGVSAIKRRPVHGAALMAASLHWSVGVSEPCLPLRAMPRAGHLFHSALPPTRAQVLTIRSMNAEANGWTVSARTGYRQPPALPLLSCEGAFAFLGKLLSVSGPPAPCPVCPPSVPRAGSPGQLCMHLLGQSHREDLPRDRCQGLALSLHREAFLPTEAESAGTGKTWVGTPIAA